MLTDSPVPAGTSATPPPARPARARRGAERPVAERPASGDGAAGAVPAPTPGPSAGVGVSDADAAHAARRLSAGLALALFRTGLDLDTLAERLAALDPERTADPDIASRYADTLRAVLAGLAPADLVGGWLHCLDLHRLFDDASRVLGLDVRSLAGDASGAAEFTAPAAACDIDAALRAELDELCRRVVYAVQQDLALADDAWDAREAAFALYERLGDRVDWVANVLEGARGYLGPDL